MFRIFADFSQELAKSIRTTTEKINKILEELIPKHALSETNKRKFEENSKPPKKKQDSPLLSWLDSHLSVLQKPEEGEKKAKNSSGKKIQLETMQLSEGEKKNTNNNILNNNNNNNNNAAKNIENIKNPKLRLL